MSALPIYQFPYHFWNPFSLSPSKIDLTSWGAGGTRFNLRLLSKRARRVIPLEGPNMGLRSNFRSSISFASSVSGDGGGDAADFTSDSDRVLEGDLTFSPIGLSPLLLLRIRP